MSRKTLAIIAILLFSFIIRVNNLSTNPAGFFADEASVGIDAKLIGETLKDRHNEFLPLFFKGFNFDNVSPYQIYLTVPFVKLFGLNETAVRLTPVFWSIIEIFIFYLLLSELLPVSIALLGTLLLSISPWHYHLSRINMGDFYSWTLLTLIAYFFLVKYCKTKITKYALLTGVFIALATYSYTPARLISPLLFGILVFLFVLKKQFKIVVLMGITFVFLLIPFIHFQLTNPHSFQRIKDTMGINVQSQNKIEQVNIKRVLPFVNKYILHYSNEFLFTKGDADFPGQMIRRHSITGIGLLYPYQKILIIAGLIWVLLKIKRCRSIELIFLMVLFLVFPLADSLTNENTPFATRSYLGVIPLHIFITFGIYSFYTLITSPFFPSHKKVLIASIIFLSILILQSANTLYARFDKNPQTTSDYWGWQYGPKEIIKYFTQVEDQYDELFLNPRFNGPEIFLKFYAPNSCKKCYVGNIQQFQKEKKQLFSLTSDEIKLISLRKIHKIIYYPNSLPAFYIVEVTNP